MKRGTGSYWREGPRAIIDYLRVKGAAGGISTGPLKDGHAIGCLPGADRTRQRPGAILRKGLTEMACPGQRPSTKAA